MPSIAAREPPTRRRRAGDGLRAGPDGGPGDGAVAGGRGPAPVGALGTHRQRGARRRRPDGRRQCGPAGGPGPIGIGRCGTGESAGEGSAAVTLDGFAAIPEAVLGPLAGRPEADWHRAPPGKWSPAQIVHHLAISVDGSGRAFQERRAKPPMRRRPRPVRQRLAPPLYLALGGVPSGPPPPPATEPPRRPAARAVGRHLRGGGARVLRPATQLPPARR